MTTSDLAARVAPVERTTAATRSLIGADDDRLRHWDLRKGITAPAEFRLVRPEARGRAVRAV